ILQQTLHRPSVQLLLPPILPPVFVQKMADQRQNILLSFTEGRNGDRNHIESKIQVLPETSFPHQIFQVSIGGGDQTEIRFLWPGTPNPVISLFLNKLQHLQDRKSVV